MKGIRSNANSTLDKDRMSSTAMNTSIHTKLNDIHLLDKQLQQYNTSKATQQNSHMATQNIKKQNLMSTQQDMSASLNRDKLLQHSQGKPESSYYQQE